MPVDAAYCATAGGSYTANGVCNPDGTCGSSDTPTPTATATAIPTATPTPCPDGGVAVAGVCWYLGAAAANCDATCAASAQFCDSATITYSGTAGTSAQCAGVLSALGVTDPYVGDMSCLFGGAGCVDIPGSQSGRCTDIPTDCSGVTFARRACACTPCPGGGKYIGGSCWYAGGAGADCDATCAAVGLTCSSATLTFAGSGGSEANCGSVVSALGGFPYAGDTPGCSAGLGCVTASSLFASYRCVDVATTCGASESFSARACACE